MATDALVREITETTHNITKRTNLLQRGAIAAAVPSFTAALVDVVVAAYMSSSHCRSYAIAA